MAAARAKPRKASRPAAGKAAAARPAKKAKTAKTATSAKRVKPATPGKPAARPATKPAPPVVRRTRTAPVPPPAPAADVAQDSPASWIPGQDAGGADARSPPPAAPVGTWQPTAPQADPGFDPATGAWRPVGPAAPPAEPAPDAPRKGTTGYVFWTILLWVDLAALAFLTVGAILSGAVLAFAPDSESAERIRGQLENSTMADIVLNTVLGFVAFGAIPFLWVWGTRRDRKEGTKRFLHLHLHRHGTGGDALARTLLWGALLAFGMVLAVAALVSTYTLATEGPDGFTDDGAEPNPAVQGILDNLSWPLAVLIALGAGIGEEIFFRGFLQRYLGVWGQAVLFGLAHSTGGYLPQILFAFALGALFGVLVKRGWSLWTLIAAHALYDFTLLALALVAPELG